METSEKSAKKRKLPVKVIVYIVVCSILVTCWMALAILLERSEALEYFFGGTIIEWVYDEELEWMEGKSVEEIEERFGPTVKNGVAGPVYFVWYDWYISIGYALNGKPQVRCNTFPLSSWIENSPFKIQDWEIPYYIVNFVGAIAVCCFPWVIWFIAWLIRKGIQRRRDAWNAYLDAVQAYRKQLAAEEEAAASAEK